MAAIPRSSQTALGAARVQTQMPHLRRYVVVAVCTQSGEFFSLIFDCVDSAVFQSWLDELDQSVQRTTWLNAFGLRSITSSTTHPKQHSSARSGNEFCDSLYGAQFAVSVLSANWMGGQRATMEVKGWNAPGAMSPIQAVTRHLGMVLIRDTFAADDPKN